MGLLRWVLWPLRGRDKEEDEPPRSMRTAKGRRKSSRSSHPGVYRIEVDGEAGRFHGDGPPFSFWSSSRIILILSFLLWWIQPAGPMIAGYVGGRRAGSPMKAVIAALMPVATIFIANAAYAHNFATHQIDFVASLPMVVSDAASSILPFLLPYKEFMIAYMKGFVSALTTTFGMGTNGYLMVIIFSYIGGLIAEQTRRELGSRSGSGTSLGVNLVQPILGARPYIDEEEEAYEEDEEVPRSHRPVRARGHGAPIVVSQRRRHRHRGAADQFDEYRKVPADDLEGHAGRRSTKSHRRDEDDEDEDADEERDEVEVRSHRGSHARAEERREHHGPLHSRSELEEDQGPERAPSSSRPPPIRSQAEERAIQRFVERALKNYDHAKL